ncbi:hypothetical protein CKM354_000906300 [Cercospora kikuchii]|uniref:Histone transcription regulator 3 homolog n=1 Tax=Cercospora kikuchii TaxID=84275 RepID=A0A9P3FIY4_9PEZI|nr:uncharacterized protein CKM354_000906300 [Cercospora kikuchii]GIZ45917.1 hypothetical protein CKM354_000906300 [Cercospora kikuchii]
MSGFRALNIEYDDESDVEVDDTKEIQIEEALKLYQTALKFHADGPESYDQAAAAYEELFKSEIFKYPESQTELERIQLYGPAPDYVPPLDGPASGRSTANNNFDTGPSTLPQILHLSHKNYAQFKLDQLSDRLDTFAVTLNQILTEATDALEHFVSSLDKDETDPDLWRRTASVGEVLNSDRITRFCLEAVLDGDEDGLDSVRSLPGLHEGFAAEQLRELIAQLQDHLSTLQSPPSMNVRRLLSDKIKARLHPYNAIINRARELRQQNSQQPETEDTGRHILPAPRTWAELGDTILQQQMSDQHGIATRPPGLAICFDKAGTLPPLPAPRDLEKPGSPQVVISRVKIPKITMYPMNLTHQFPGLDNGRPTVQPQIASADASMTIAGPSPVEVETELSTMTLPSRKRSGDVAGLQDTEEGRTKSKRLRARDSIVDAAAERQADANTRWEHEQALNEFQAADDWMFGTVSGLFERIGIVGFDAARHVRQEMQTTDSGDVSPVEQGFAASSALRHARRDIQGLLGHWKESMAHLVLLGGENLDISQSQNLLTTSNMFGSVGSSKALTKLDPLPNDGLQDLVDIVNEGWSLTTDVACKFIDALLRPGKLSVAESSYVKYQWPETLKTVVVRVIVNFDETLYKQAAAEVAQWQTPQTNGEVQTAVHDLSEIIQSIFELHLDVYSLIKQANSGVAEDTIVAQGDRLQRWSQLARDIMLARQQTDLPDLKDDLNIRFLWATTFAIGASEDVNQEHTIGCMHDLKRILVEADMPGIHLPNNAIMPEVSLDALERELSKLTMKDFFVKVTNQDVSDPASVIVSLEPLLESLDAVKHTDNASNDEPTPALPPNVQPEFVRFLETSPVSVRLMLWQRLRDAYIKIDYKPKVVCCYLRMIGIVLEEMKTSENANLEPAERLVTELKSLRLISEWVKLLFDLIHGKQDAIGCMGCMDDDYIRFAVRNFGELLQLLQVFNVVNDAVSVGRIEAPSVQSFRAVMTWSHETQVRVWIILYAIFQEAISENKNIFLTPTEDRFEFLRVVHRNLGIRGICSCLNRAFVRMLKDEFFSMTHVDGYDTEQAQVLYDLYGLNCFIDPDQDLIEHNCTHDAFLDRGVALQAVDLLLAQASKLPMKELVKHTLKDTIEKVHGALARRRPSEAILRNRETIKEFLKSNIQPLELYSCVKGEGNHLAVHPVPEGDAVLASKGWFFLMGHMSLTKFRAQKRTGPTPTEDVDIAIAFFMQDLEFTMNHWETWFRLGQAYDTKIEESVVWSAEKLNNSMQDITTLQKYVIHCFTMATALAHRSADLKFETSSKMAELYSDFALRLYASSREPFSMKPFEVEEENIFVSDHKGVHRSTSLKPMRLYTVWKLANTMFKKALRGRSDQWQLHYMVGKCLWKMHNASDELRRRDQPPTGPQVVDAFVKALELLPDKDRKESKDSKREPTLEPHYKLLVIVDKLWRKGTLDSASMKQALDHSHYARKEGFPESMDKWTEHVLAVLKALSKADKSNWYHRMIARTANIAYEQNRPSAEPTTEQLDACARAANNVLTQQMFTKTMVLQVWRPENERAGRHFVYTSRYTRFMVKILKQLKDRVTLETLAKRVRRRQNDLFEQSLVWQDICAAWLYLLRTYGGLSEGLETACFSNIAYEDFVARKDPLEVWMQNTPSGESPALDVLREVQELKKINQGLMKPGAIDDLIGDSYAHLFSTVGKQLWEQEERQKREAEANKPLEPAPAPTPATVTSPPRNPMMSLTHLMNVDGASDAVRTAPAAPAPVPVPAPAIAEPDLAPVRRKIGVGRREIRTNAEACAFKGGSASNKDKAGTNASAQPKGVMDVIDQERRSSLPGGFSVENSAPASIHENADDADDESELSDLEEERDDEEDRDDDMVPASSPLPGAPTDNQTGTVAGENDVEMGDEGD